MIPRIAVEALPLPVCLYICDDDRHGMTQCVWHCVVGVVVYMCAFLPSSSLLPLLYIRHAFLVLGVLVGHACVACNSLPLPVLSIYWSPDALFSLWLDMHLSPIYLLHSACMCFLFTGKGIGLGPIPILSLVVQHLSTRRNRARTIAFLYSTHCFLRVCPHLKTSTHFPGLHFFRCARSAFSRMHVSAFSLVNILCLHRVLHFLLSHP